MMIRITEPLCDQINRDAGITGDVTSAFDSMIHWEGSFDAPVNTLNWDLGGSVHAPGINGFNTGCIKGDPGDSYEFMFYYVLLAR